MGMERDPKMPRGASPSDPRAPERAGGLAPAFEGKHLAVGADGTLRVAAWSGERLEEWSGKEALARLPSLRERPDVALWVDYAGPSPEQVSEIGQLLELHPLIIEDVVEGNQRSKIETTDGLVHIVLFALEYGDRVAASEIDIVLGLGFLLTVHDPDWDPRGTAHLKGGVEQVLRKGPDHLLWALSDSIVDDYFPFADDLGDAIDEIQDLVIDTASRAALERLLALKRDLISVRRAAAPVREIFSQLTNRELSLVDEEEVLYFRDIYDHVIRLTDELDTYRELVSGTLEVYLSTVNNNLSRIMKRLTGVTVVVAGVGAVAGIFGMSEATPAFVGGEGPGFWLVTVATLVGAAATAFVLRRIDWI